MARANLKRWFRFSLGTLLFAVLCVAGYLGGYRSGFDEGLKSGRAVQLKSYPVADLVFGPGSYMSTADVNSLIDVIQLQVAPETWKSHGLGVGEIKWLPNNLSLMVYQSPAVHGQVDDLLKGLRKRERLNMRLSREE